MEIPIEDLWVRVELPGEELSDAIHIPVRSDATILGLKKILVEELASSVPEPIALHRVLITLPPAPGETGEARHLLAPCLLADLPADAGGPKWPFVAKVRIAAAAASPKPAPKKPETLFEKGLAGKHEPPQIRNAKDIRELYPGGVLPRTGIKDEHILIKILKLVLVFTLLFGIAGGAMYMLGEVLPKYYISRPGPGYRPGMHTEL